MSAPSRIENLQNLRTANADVAFATAFGTLVTGTFIVGYIKLLGGSDLWIGLISALPSMFGILQIPGAIIGRRYTSYKKFILTGAAPWRALYIPVAILPLLALPPNLALTLLLICVSAAAACTLFVNPTYNEWISTMVPERSRGWYFSRRNMIATTVGGSVGIVGGLSLDAFRHAGQERIGLSVIFGIGVICAGISMSLFLRMKDGVREAPVRESLIEGLRAVKRPFADREFRKVLVFISVFFVGQAFAGNLYTAYALESLKLSFTVIQMTGVMQALGMVAAFKLWGFLADKYGNKPMLMLSGLGIATNPIAWLLTVPGNDVRNIAVLLPGHFFMGLFWSGVALCQFNILLATSREDDRANYLAAGLTLQSVMAGVAPLVGAALMASARVSWGPTVAYKTVFITALVLRATAVLFLIPVREEGSSRFGKTLSHLRTVTPRGVRAMRSLSRSGEEATRAEAIETVAREGYALASEEVAKALSDPSPVVRRQAAAALGKLGDPSAAAALIEHLEEHPDLVEEETIEALGALGNPSAVPLLTKFLKSPRSMLRRASARALGRIESPAAIEPLKACAGETGDPDLRRVSIQALRAHRAMDAAGVISDALFDPHPSVRTAAAEAVSELELTDALPYVRQSLAYYQDEAVSEVAYALGAIGTVEDLPLILQTAQAATSTTSRRRSLLGAARLLGVESTAYRLMLREGMDRDAALMATLGTKGKRNPKLQVALARYSGGDERGAIEALASSSRKPELRVLAEYVVDESFLVAACLVG